MTGTIIISILVLLFGFLIYRARNGSQATTVLLNKMNVNESTLVFMGKYICGHVDIDLQLNTVKIGLTNENLVIFF